MYRSLVVWRAEKEEQKRCQDPGPVILPAFSRQSIDGTVLASARKANHGTNVKMKNEQTREVTPYDAEKHK
jgi:hypothetical protein